MPHTNTSLIWGVSRWLAPRPLSPVEQLIEESRSSTEKAIRVVWRLVWMSFVVSPILRVLNALMVLAWQNLASPLGVVLGLPLVLLTSIDWLSGFILLIVSPFSI